MRDGLLWRTERGLRREPAQDGLVTASFLFETVLDGRGEPRLRSFGIRCLPANWTGTGRERLDVLCDRRQRFLGSSRWSAHHKADDTQQNASAPRHGRTVAARVVESLK